jgi:hypothetical protein
LKSFKIFKSEIKKLKTYSGLCAFKGLFNDTTLTQIQSGRTVPLKTGRVPYLGLEELTMHVLKSQIRLLRQSL